MKRWAVLAIVCTLAVTAWVGWDRYTKLRPPAAAVATRTMPADLAGVRYRVTDVSRVARIDVADHDPLVAPPGAVWVRLAFTMELLDPATRMDSLRCTGFLVSGSNEWSDDSDPASYADDLTQRRCNELRDDQPLTIGTTKRLVMHWLVPSAAADKAQFYLRFSTPPRSIELRP